MTHDDLHDIICDKRVEVQIVNNLAALQTTPDTRKGYPYMSAFPTVPHMIRRWGSRNIPHVMKPLISG
jgi:hypothetical protein